MQPGAYRVHGQPIPIAPPIPSLNRSSTRVISRGVIAGFISFFVPHPDYR